MEDDWRIKNSLTLNLGVAWDMTTPISEEHGRLANYVPATGQVLIANVNGVSPSAGVNGLESLGTSHRRRLEGLWQR